MQAADGSFRALALGDDAGADPGGFFGDRSCIHAKVAIAFLELDALTGGRGLREAALRACEHTMTLQTHDGAFRSRPDGRSVFTHAHCYACEGLLYAGSLLGESRYVAAARRGIERLSARQRDEGGWLSSHCAPALSPRRAIEAALRPMPTDAAAQAARLFSLAGAEFDAARRAALRFLIDSQEERGAFPYRRTRFGRSPLRHTWCTQFAIQALVWDRRARRARGPVLSDEPRPREPDRAPLRESGRRSDVRARDRRGRVRAGGRAPLARRSARTPHPRRGLRQGEAATGAVRSGRAGRRRRPGLGSDPRGVEERPSVFVRAIDHHAAPVRRLHIRRRAASRSWSTSPISTPRWPSSLGC